MCYAGSLSWMRSELQLGESRTVSQERLEQCHRGSEGSFSHFPIVRHKDSNTTRLPNNSVQIENDNMLLFRYIATYLGPPTPVGHLQ